MLTIVAWGFEPCHTLAQAALAQRNVQLEAQLQALVAEQQAPDEPDSSGAAADAAAAADRMAGEACANGCSDASWQDAAIQARFRQSRSALVLSFDAAESDHVTRPELLGFGPCHPHVHPYKEHLSLQPRSNSSFPTPFSKQHPYICCSRCWQRSCSSATVSCSPSAPPRPCV